jgi:peptidoglycan hydrolase-like protein with peptidoglycan-binding domain
MNQTLTLTTLVSLRTGEEAPTVTAPDRLAQQQAQEGPDAQAESRQKELEDQLVSQFRQQVSSEPQTVKVANPVAGDYTVTSPFGMRVHPIHGDMRMHNGIDLAAPMGTPILSAMDGTIEEMTWMGGYGYTIDVRHDDGSMTRYAHLGVSQGDPHSAFTSDLYDRFKAGQAVRVTAGQEIGKMGSTGGSTGSHLHFEYHPAGSGAVDPAGLIRDGATVSSQPREAAETFSHIAGAQTSSYIRRGSAGIDKAAIQSAQTALMLWANSSDNVDQGLIEQVKAEQEKGIFGERSEQLLRGFQSSYGLNDKAELIEVSQGQGLKVDGVLGIRTLNALAQWVDKNAQSEEVKELFRPYIYTGDRFDDFLRLTNGRWGGREGVANWVGDDADIALNKLGKRQDELSKAGIENGFNLLDKNGNLVYQRAEKLSEEQKARLAKATAEWKEMIQAEETVKKTWIEARAKEGIHVRSIESNGVQYTGLLAFDDPKYAAIDEFFDRAKVDLNSIVAPPDLDIRQELGNNVPTAPVAEGRSMRFVGLDKEDPGSGNELGALLLYEDRRLVRSFAATSGKPFAKDNDRKIANQEAPLPNGTYTIDTWGASLTNDPEIGYNSFLSIDAVDRSAVGQRTALGIHFDPSGDGTAGCIGLLEKGNNGQADLQWLKEFTKGQKGMVLEVDY